MRIVSTARRSCVSLLLAALLAAPAWAEDPSPPASPPAAPAAPAAPSAKRVVVAVLDFTAGHKDVKDLADSLPDLLESAIGASKSVTLVSRRDLKTLQSEQKLDLAGLVADG